MVGKDILRFHAIYWPALLISAGFDHKACCNLCRHPFPAYRARTLGPKNRHLRAQGRRPAAAAPLRARLVDKNGQKMSKSIGNVVDPIALVDEHG